MTLAKEDKGMFYMEGAHSSREMYNYRETAQIRFESDAVSVIYASISQVKCAMKDYPFRIIQGTALMEKYKLPASIKPGNPEEAIGYINDNKLPAIWELSSEGNLAKERVLSDKYSIIDKLTQTLMIAAAKEGIVLSEILVKNLFDPMQRDIVDCINGKDTKTC